MARPFKFPDAGDRSPNQPAVMCPAKRVLALYNQDSGDTAQRLSPKVKTWFTRTALSQGWARVWWFEHVSTNHGVGCVMSVEEVAPAPYELNEAPRPPALRAGDLAALAELAAPEEDEEDDDEA